MQALMISILNPIYEKWISRIDQKSRELIVGFIFVLLALYFPLCHSGCLQYLIYTETQRQIFAAIMIFGAALFSMQAPLERVCWNKWIMVPMWLGGLGLLFTRILHPIGSGYAAFGVMLLTVYPCLYFVWINRGDIERLFDIISWVNVLVGVCYIAYSTALLRVYPWKVVVAGRVRGTMNNANLYSMVGMMVACCALYLLYRVWEKKGKRGFLLAALVIGIIVMVAGQSRASVLVVAGAIIAVFIFAVKCGRLNKRVVRTTVAVCCILALGVALFAALQGGASDIGDDGTHISVVERFLPVQKDANNYTSGRIGLWKNYAKHLNLFGNDFTQVDWEELTNNTVGHAHNNFLEYGFRSGVLVSGVFLFAELTAMIIAAQYLFSKRRVRDYMLFCSLFALAYLLESLVDVATIPMERYAPFFFYLMLAGMAGRKNCNTDDAPVSDNAPQELRIP